MNERIFTELYKKAWGHFPCPTGEPELEKFAELIVEECLLAISKTKITDEEIPTMIKCHDQVEQHFGVE